MNDLNQGLYLKTKNSFYVISNQNVDLILNCYLELKCFGFFTFMDIIPVFL